MIKAGIIVNTTKSESQEVLIHLIKELLDAGLAPGICSDGTSSPDKNRAAVFPTLDELGAASDFIISLGGDGTLLASAPIAYKYNIPIVGINLGKLGFLAEISHAEISNFISELKNGVFAIEERIVLEAVVASRQGPPLVAVNDLVVDKGSWPKMIEISLVIDGKYVTTFSADGLIIATPGGSTGYSLSTGGPIVTPSAPVITLSPISAHSLTVRPLVIAASQQIELTAASLHKKVQVNCDGQTVVEYAPPLRMTVKRSEKPLKLLRNPALSYFDILRTKLFWGLDYRRMKNNNEGESE